MNVGAASSKSTAHTTDNYAPQEDFQADSDTEVLPPAAPRTVFNIQNETGKRGAKPESNKIRDTEMNYIHQKKEKCLELFRNNGDIRDLIVSRETNPQGLELNQIVDMLYSSSHFLNRKFFSILKIFL